MFGAMESRRAGRRWNRSRHVSGLTSWATFFLAMCGSGAGPAAAAPPLAAGEARPAGIVPNEYIVVFGDGMPRSPLAGRFHSADAFSDVIRQSLEAEAAAKAAGGVILHRFRAALIGFIARLPDAAL